MNKVSSLKVQDGSPGFTFPNVFCENTNVAICGVPSASRDAGKQGTGFFITSLYLLPQIQTFGVAEPHLKVCSK